MRPAKLFPAPFRVPKVGTIRILRETFVGGSQHDKDLLYKKLPANYHFTGFTIVGSPHEADFIIGQCPVRLLNEDTKEYIERVKQFAKEAGKPLILFLGRDDSHTIHIKGVHTLFCNSIYGRTKQRNELFFPPYVQDLGEEKPFVPRKKGTRPVVAFCGYAGFPTLRTKVAYYVKNALYDLKAILMRDSYPRLYKRGIYWRKRSMDLLARDSRIETRFIVRNSFSGNSKLVSGNPEDVHREYVDNMFNADFALAPKGDPNNSSRFYEALALGRIPILIDTDMTLPLQKVIDYDSFILRIPYTNISEIADRVVAFYNSMTDEEFAAKQRAAREAFEKYLRYDTFFNTVFPLLLERKPETLN